jgi:hypothetical protein
MGFWDRFKAGMDIGVKVKVSHRGIKGAGKDVYKSSSKWEKKMAKAERKAAKEMKKT